jgi:hypothetical protein
MVENLRPIPPLDRSLGSERHIDDEIGGVARARLDLFRRD